MSAIRVRKKWGKRKRQVGDDRSLVSVCSVGKRYAFIGWAFAIATYVLRKAYHEH